MQDFSLSLIIFVIGLVIGYLLSLKFSLDLPKIPMNSQAPQRQEQRQPPRQEVRYEESRYEQPRYQDNREDQDTHNEYTNRNSIKRIEKIFTDNPIQSKPQRPQQPQQPKKKFRLADTDVSKGDGSPGWTDPSDIPSDIGELDK